ncbi:hypothetical protein [Cerasicoccus frondis]|uniref:hypothetical protein n=1 Tax=Cerasicoccus frondis TaxID=490090 RepID=UPI002852CB69|nr:hypothetical protein [Cerasicoccus frondis]
MRKLFYILLWGCFSVAGFAQSEQMVSVRFRCLSLDAPIRTPLYVRPEGGEAIRIYNNARTDWIQYSGPLPIVFYKDSEVKGAPRVPVAKFNLNPEVEAPLLLFSRSKSGPAEYDIYSINDSAEFSPVGSFRIYNFTEKDVAGKIGDQVFRVKPNAFAVTKIPETDSVSISVKLAEGTSDGVKRLFAATWNFSSKFRYLVFIMPSDDPTRGNIQIRKITDYVSGN